MLGVYDEDLGSRAIGEQYNPKSASGIVATGAAALPDGSEQMVPFGVYTSAYNGNLESSNTGECGDEIGGY